MVLKAFWTGSVPFTGSPSSSGFVVFSSDSAWNGLLTTSSPSRVNCSVSGELDEVVPVNAMLSLALVSSKSEEADCGDMMRTVLPVLPLPGLAMPRSYLQHIVRIHMNGILKAYLY